MRLSSLVLVGSCFLFSGLLASSCAGVGDDRESTTPTLDGSVGDLARTYDLASVGPPDLAAGPSCFDNRMNGTETDIDCGGATCDPCSDGKGCTYPRDCKGGQCVQGTCQSAATCNDGVRNGDETDVDCGGGACGVCADGKKCLKGTDCRSNSCVGNVCKAAATCNDAVRNGNETDVDCGGGTCAACANGKVCKANSDCQSNACSGGVCKAPPVGCADGIKNGTETDVDCGGATCGACANGKACLANTDCQSKTCTGGKCVVPKFGCNSLVNCLNVNACADQACVDACTAKVNTVGGITLFNRLFSCVFDIACPSTLGGVCEFTGAACDACVMKCQSQGGACYNDLQACGQDG